MPHLLPTRGKDPYRPLATEAENQTQRDDADQEVEFDWDEDTPGIVWYSARKHDEDDSVEDGREDEDSDEDVSSAEETEETNESDADSDLGSDSGDDDAIPSPS